MKKWERPVVVEEQFVTNSSVSACYSLVCTLPGDNPYIEDGSKDNWINSYKVKDRAKYHAIWGQQTFPDLLLEKHDENCASPARYNADTGVFKESGGNAAQVSNIHIDKDNPVAEAIATQASRATPMPSIPEMSEVWGPIDAALQLSVTGKQDVKAALTGATEHIHNQIEAFRSGM